MEERPDRQARHEEFSSAIRNERTIAPGFTPCQGAMGRAGREKYLLHPEPELGSGILGRTAMPLGCSSSERALKARCG